MGGHILAARTSVRGMRMESRRGSGVNDLKLQNRRLVLRTIAEHPMISRAEISLATGLSKMTMSNIIGELMQAGVVCESAQERSGAAALGRRPGYLDLADTSPCEIGVFISRHGVQVSVGDLRTRVLWTHSEPYPAVMNEQLLIEMTLAGIRRALQNCRRPVLGIGLAAIGPVSIERGTILRPANFFGMRDVPIVRAVAEETGYPVCFTSDNMAGAQAEKLFGEGRAHENFLFLLLWEGIGCGVVVDGKLHAGEHGLGGELGHTSICFDGPVCSCGSRGCLETYANTEHMAEHVRRRIAGGETSVLQGQPLNWATILNAASVGDGVALSAVEEYCDYLSCALVTMVNVFDPEIIYLCQHESGEGAALLAGLLQKRIYARMLAPDCRRMSVRCASFGERAVMAGSLALVAGKVFDGSLPFMPFHAEGGK